MFVCGEVEEDEGDVLYIWLDEVTTMAARSLNDGDGCSRVAA